VDIFVAALVIGSLTTTFICSNTLPTPSLFNYFLISSGSSIMSSLAFSPQTLSPAKSTAPLWTVPFEIGCYALMSGLIVAGAVKSQKRMVVAVAGFTMLYYGLYFIATPILQTPHCHNYINNFISERGITCTLISSQGR